jgi:hypothetical protein
MIPSIGRIVQYELTEADVDQINRRRKHAQFNMDEHREAQKGTMVYVGNHATEKQVFPMMITRVWGSEEGSAVNGQVFLDGNDVLWASSVTEGEGPGHWSVPPRVG